MPSYPRTIHIRVLAPRKPSVGAPCNGCGLCCLAEPCPLGMALTMKRKGACGVLVWNEGRARYECGALVAPQELVQARLPGPLRWLAPPLVTMLRRMGARWIAAGIGCDSDLEPVDVASSAQLSANRTAHDR